MTFKNSPASATPLRQLASEAKFRFNIGGQDLEVLAFNATEEISAMYQVDVTFAADREYRFEELKQKEAVLTVGGHQQDQPDRVFHGIIRKLRTIGGNGTHQYYKAQVVPSLWLLSIRENCRTFQHSTIEEIISHIIKGYPATINIDFRLALKNVQRKFCVQFQESDLHFVSRLLEEEGIFYFFEHFRDKHVLVLCDTPAFYREIDGKAAVMFNDNGGMVAEEESVFSFYQSERIRSGRFTHRNYNFKRPTLDIMADDEEDDGPEAYEFPGAFGDNERGRQLAKIRLQEINTLREKACGESLCPRLAPGATFTLTDHKTTSHNGDYLLIEVSHHGRQPQSLGELAGDSPASYTNAFLAVPATVSYRPERITSKPVVPGIQTATVTGPTGEEIYTDRYGRVKVQFPWDRNGKGDETTSCWLRVAQFWNGSIRGSQFLPRVGDEVLVAFINGDMDYPIVIGSSINENLAPNYPLPANKTQSGIRTRSYPNGGRDNFHELRFEDKKGSEHIYLQSERDWNILVKNDKAQQVGHDEALEVGNNRFKTVGVDQVEQVGRNASETIGANQSISVGANKTESVAINSAETVGLAKELTVGGAYQVSVAGVMNETVLGAKTEEVGITKQVLVGSHMVERVAGNRSLTVGEGLSTTVSKAATVKAKTIVLDADDEIVLKCGGATISLKADGSIVLDGASCTQNASGEIVIKGARTSVN